MIEYRLVPRFAGVAGTAISTTMSDMAVVFEMAARTGHVHHVVKRVRTMTVGAGQGRVFEFKWKICIARVIETRIAP